ncbi:MAG: glycosyl transferase family protein [uncultured bacterium]|nr:MAG: glycosyl transferase family protein [uncultured bacterium]
MKNKLPSLIINNLSSLRNFLSKKENFYFYIIFLLALSIHFYYSLIGWSHNLLDQYGFRQTQTAITTYYAIKEGFKLNYITPVLGAPWSIPFEFPLFQWVVAGFVLLFKTPIDQTGRFISLTFFYLSLFPLYAILKAYLKKTNYVLIILSLILLNPIYLFWSRTFMIESLALFLGILFCWLAINLIQTKKLKFHLLVSMVGSLTALVKITTFAVLCFPTLSIFIYYFLKEKNNKFPSMEIITKYARIALSLFVIPLLAGIIWTHFADVQKSINPLANGFITSKDLTAWNFGTIQQKIDPLVWINIFKNSFVPMSVFGIIEISDYLIPGFFVVFLLFIIFTKAYRREMLFSLLFFLSGPVIFTNLYFVHNYYFYANNFFLSILLGLLIITCLEQKHKIKMMGSMILFPIMIFTLWSTYMKEFYPYQYRVNDSIMASTEVIKQNTNQDGTILIYGQNWDPSFSYYAERKAIMNWQEIPLSNKKIQKSIKKTGGVSALIFSNNNDEKFITDQIKNLNFNEIPIYNDNQTRIYLPK